jgi:hypothetical protein
MYGKWWSPGGSCSFLVLEDGLQVSLDDLLFFYILEDRRQVSVDDLLFYFRRCPQGVS